MSYWDHGRAQTCRAFFYAVIVHLCLASGFLFIKHSVPDITPGDTIPVTVVFETIPSAPAAAPETVTPKPKPVPKPAVKSPTPPPRTNPIEKSLPDITDQPPFEEEEETREDSELTSPITAPAAATLIISETPTGAPLKPGSRWALNPPLSTENLNGLGMLKDDIECLQSLSSDCTDLRKEIFAEYQMSETDKVWSPQYAHSGLSSDFYGLSEREIRQKLGLHLAGENGLYIPFTNIGLNGGIWDKMHGVNTGCKSKIGRTSAMEGGRQIMIKDCPSYQEGSKNGP